MSINALQAATYPKSNAAVEALKAADREVTKARTERDELSSLREKLARKHSDLSAHRVGLSAELGLLTLAAAREDSATTDVTPKREAVAKVAAELDELASAIGALDTQLRTAEAVYAAAEHKARSVRVGVARALAPKLQEEVRAMFRDVCRLQYQWGVLAKTGELPYTGRYSLHPDPTFLTDHDELPGIARSEGIFVESFYLRNEPLDLTADELIELASERDDLTFDPAAPSLPVNVDPTPRSPVFAVDARGFNSVPSDDGCE